MERTDSWERPMTRWSPVPVLAAYYDAVTVICELAAQFSDRAWHQPTPCDDWRAADLAGHLRCMADDYHEYLDDAPVSRLRSEEHTSELQSRPHLVCRLLLEKKKKK